MARVALVALAVASAFDLGSWFADRRVAAVVAVLRSFCRGAAAYCRARDDGRIDDAEARQKRKPRSGERLLSSQWVRE
ncbi:MAG TPA: hypothetical protein HA263_05925 [Methanoregulaceae archaeon]|nr:hypothetical protein [Methanoregulaceae archaeon]